MKPIKWYIITLLVLTMVWTLLGCQPTIITDHRTTATHEITTQPRRESFSPDTHSSIQPASTFTTPLAPTDDYREKMRQWVITISETARALHPDFIIIPQNCSALLTDDGTPQGSPASSFIQAIDGLGQESLSYGSIPYGTPRDDDSRDKISHMLDVGHLSGLTILTVDYTRRTSDIEQVQQYNEAHGYTGFIASSTELREIPGMISSPSTSGITQLNDASNWLLLLNPGEHESKTDYLTALRRSAYDLLVIDAFFDGDEALSSLDVSRLQYHRNGTRRLVIAYLSIGEAEDYRYYWLSEYDHDPPDWMLQENPNWIGNYPVKYWHPQWQEIIATGENSYLKRIIDAGFDGVYLDIVDGYLTFEDLDESPEP